MRTIDADELKKMFPDKGEGAWTYNTTAQGYINAMPTVDLWHYPSRGEYPPKGRQILVYAWNVHFMLAKYDNMRTIDEGDKDMFVTYDANCVMREIKKVIAWMPLPKPPKEEE